MILNDALDLNCHPDSDLERMLILIDACVFWSSFVCIQGSIDLPDIRLFIELLCNSRAEGSSLTSAL